jgi:hypothetical protein
MSCSEVNCHFHALAAAAKDSLVVTGFAFAGDLAAHFLILVHGVERFKDKKSVATESPLEGF